MRTGPRSGDESGDPQFLSNRLYEDLVAKR
jgi:hypothetical protein